MKFFKWIILDSEDYEKSSRDTLWAFKRLNNDISNLKKANKTLICEKRRMMNKYKLEQKDLKEI